MPIYPIPTPEQIGAININKYNQPFGVPQLNAQGELVGPIILSVYTEAQLVGMTGTAGTPFYVSDSHEFGIFDGVTVGGRRWTTSTQALAQYKTEVQLAAMTPDDGAIIFTPTGRVVRGDGATPGGVHVQPTGTQLCAKGIEDIGGQGMLATAVWGVDAAGKYMAMVPQLEAVTNCGLNMITGTGAIDLFFRNMPMFTSINFTTGGSFTFNSILVEGCPAFSSMYLNGLDFVLTFQQNQLVFRGCPAIYVINIAGSSLLNLNYLPSGVVVFDDVGFADEAIVNVSNCGLEAVGLQRLMAAMPAIPDPYTATIITTGNPGAGDATFMAAAAAKRWTVV